MPLLTNLLLRDNNLYSLDLYTCKNITYLTIVGNDFTEINLDSCESLRYFNGGSNDLITVDFSNNLALETISLVANELPSIDVSFLSELDDLNVTSNNLTSLDVSANDKLLELYASYNDLGSIDLSNNKLLKILFLAECNLDDINLLNNKDLEQIYLIQNNFTSLNLNSNLMLDRVVLSENPLVEMDLSKHVLLTRVEFNDCPDLQALNIKNGNNSNVTTHRFTLCPMLSCISVDNVSYANTNFTNKDASTSFSLDCGYCFNSYLNIDTALCAGETYTSPNTAVYNTSGIYYDSLANSCGRDSVITLSLKVHELDAVQLMDEEFCPGDTVYFYGDAVTSSGTLQYVLTNVNGCDSIVSKTFTVLENTITNNNGILEATPNMDTYQWFFNGDSIENAIIANYTPTASGDYYCEATKNACASVSNSLNVDLETAIKDIAFTNLSIYPNPTNGLVNIEIEEHLSSIRVLDLTGKELQSYPANSRELSMSTFTPGIYLLELANRENKSIVKLIKK